MDSRDAANTYFESRDRGELDHPAFESALRVYRSHFPTTSDNAARPLLALLIAEASAERGRGR